MSRVVQKRCFGLGSDSGEVLAKTVSEAISQLISGLSVNSGVRRGIYRGVPDRGRVRRRMREVCEKQKE